jgi:YHS domain-containing protein
VALRSAALAAGCSIGQSQPFSQARRAAGNEKTEATGDQVAEAMANPDPADRDAAKLQAVCPVSDEKLGSMGAPFKVAVMGKEFFLCCEGCNDDFQKDPQKFVAKLKP